MPIRWLCMRWGADLLTCMRVHGAVFKATDPVGLESTGAEGSGAGANGGAAGDASPGGNWVCGTCTFPTDAILAGGFKGNSPSASGGDKPGGAPSDSSRPVIAAPSDGPSKFNPYSTEGRVGQALFGSEPSYQVETPEQARATATIGAGFIPILNSAIVLSNPNSTTAEKVFAVGADALTIVPPLAGWAKSAALARGVGTAAKVAKGKWRLQREYRGCDIQTSRGVPPVARLAQRISLWR